MLITRRAEFCASHVCRQPARTDQENAAIYGAEANPRGHGHNFVLEVTLEGEPDPATGMVYDLKRLKEILRQEIIDVFDHRFLNVEVPPFDKVVPTPENMAIEIWRRLEGWFPEPQARLYAVRLADAEDHWVEYRGGSL
ncbi:MAG: 6-carboxytetrahydropterin synthase [Bryobacterales bacterium]|nr:6-carboxytetrahydropterin synthase [Bryobacterales bacterium]